MDTQVRIKDPDDRLDYEYDGTEWLVDDNIINVEYFINSDELVIETGLCYLTDKKAVIFLSGGVLGKTYEITARLTTENHRILDWTFKIRCKQR